MISVSILDNCGQKKAIGLLYGVKQKIREKLIRVNLLLYGAHPRLQV